jgi:hypothetical protein
MGSTLFFIVILPVPMVWFGVYIIINALTFKITLSPDKLTMQDGTSETEVDRSQIEAYRVTKDQIELKTESSIIRKSIPKKFDTDPEFATWFDGVHQVPEYKPSVGLANYNYPRLYKPRLFSILISFGYLYCAFKVFQHFSNNTGNYLIPRMHVDFWGGWVGVFGVFILVYFYVLPIFVYKISIYRNFIEINSLFFNKKVLRDEILSYRYFYGGKQYSKVYLQIKRPANNKQNQTKEVVIHLTFYPDQAFNDWFSEIPCRGGLPLPKIKEEFN